LASLPEEKVIKKLFFLQFVVY